MKTPGTELRLARPPAIAALFALCLLGAAVTHAQSEPAKALHQIFDEEWEWTLNENPLMASFVGSTKHLDKLPDLSREAIARRQQHALDLLARLDALEMEELDDADQLNYELFRYGTQLAVDGAQFPSELLALNQMGGAPTMLVQMAAMAPRLNAGHFDALLDRLDKSPHLLQQTKDLLDEGVERGVTPPKITLRGVAETLAMLGGGEAAEHPIYQSAFANMPASISAADAERLQSRAKSILETKVLPAYLDFHRYWTQTYFPKSRDSIALADLPNGADWYAYNVRLQTTTNLTPQEIHDIGLREVARIRGLMEEVKRESGFEGSLDDFFEFLRTDPRFFFTDKEDLLSAYRDIAKRVDAELPALFSVLPRLPYGVQAVPAYQEKNNPTAYYNPGSAEIGRAGTFFANTYDLPSRPKWEMEALTIHEAVPGHHLQIALASELEGLPEFRKYGVMGGGFTAYVEGWGLYSESLGPELGFYKDPYSKFGQLTYEMWRAIRLVVDTGMHAKGWSRQQAIDYFRANSGKAEHDITVEIDRYIVMPGQALAYKLGELKIKELRAFAEAELGDGFDVRAFHDHLLGAGALPLQVLDRRMRAWVGATHPSP